MVLPTFLRESRATIERLDAVRRRHEPARHPAAPGGARAVADAASTWPTLAPDLEAFFRDLDPLITRLEAGLPATSRCSTTRAPLLGQLDPSLRQLNPVAGLPRPLQARADGVLRQRRGGHAGDRSARARRALHYLRTTNPLNPENLAALPAPARHQPLRTRTRCRALRPSSHAGTAARHVFGQATAAPSNPHAAAARPEPSVVPATRRLPTQVQPLRRSAGTGNVGAGAAAVPPSRRRSGRARQGERSTQLPARSKPRPVSADAAVA